MRLPRKGQRELAEALAKRIPRILRKRQHKLE